MVEAVQSHFLTLTCVRHAPLYKTSNCEYDLPGRRCVRESHRCTYIHRSDVITTIQVPTWFDVTTMKFANGTYGCMLVGTKWYKHDKTFVELCKAAEKQAQQSTGVKEPSLDHEVPPPVRNESKETARPSNDKKTVPPADPQAVRRTHTSTLTRLPLTPPPRLPAAQQTAMQFAFPSAPPGLTKRTPKIPTAATAAAAAGTTAKDDKSTLLTDVSKELMPQIFLSQFTSRASYPLQDPDMAVSYCKTVRVGADVTAFKCEVQYEDQKVDHTPSGSSATLRASRDAIAHTLCVTNEINFTGYYGAVLHDDGALTRFEPLTSTEDRSAIVLTPNTSLIIVRLESLLPWHDRWVVNLNCANNVVVVLTAASCRYLGLKDFATAEARFRHHSLHIEAYVWHDIVSSAYDYTVQFDVRHAKAIFDYHLSDELLHKVSTDIYASLNYGNAHMVLDWINGMRAEQDGAKKPLRMRVGLDSMIIRKCWALM